MERQKQIHNIPPLYDSSSRVLILGSFPSVKSRKEEFFYAHPQNRFWPMLAAIFCEPIPKSTKEKKMLALSHRVALWDAIGSCEIAGSSDASIEQVIPNDFSAIFAAADIQAVFCNGSTAYTCYNKYCRAQTGYEAVLLPSTSPTNARWTKEMLEETWRKKLLTYL